MKANLKIRRILFGFILTIAAVVFVVAMIFLFLMMSGRNRLANQNRGVIPLLAHSDLMDAEFVGGDWQEGDVRYQGVHYRYNQDIMTFLFLGIDKMEEVAPVRDGIDGGQADAIFLLVLDPHKKEISVIGVNRDTMTDVDVYDRQGLFVGTETLVICLQHGYGDGAELSCERTVSAVSNLFYGLPISGYCSINMGAIPLINDAVGGVTVTALEDVINSDIKKGDEILLQGMDAYAYLHNRDTTVDESARMRLERQKQYLTAYSKTVMGSLRSHLTLPIGLYRILEKYMVTDVSIDEVSYLATQVADYTFDAEHIYTLEGKTELLKGFEVFYPDETALYELILKVFYEEVEEV